MRATLLTVLALAACGDDAHSHGATDGGPGSGVVDSGPVSSCDPPGHFGGAPTETFDLPPSSPNQLAYDDVQAAFPAVHWDTLDRLYLPAGHYTNLMLGNLPARDAAHPLIITNKGGQVVVGFNPQGNYIWSMGGGAHWILTGRYDALSQTGDAAFAGHACGAYAHSAGTYGIVSDDDYAFSAPYLHMGLAVGGGATDFEIEYVEVARSGFAGIRLLNDSSLGLDKPMANVKVHDVYIHDTAAEGFYFGWTGAPPANEFPHLEIYNCRILRAGNETLQIQDLGDGTHVHHNTFISGGLHWLDNGLGRYQDNLLQMLVREGQIEIDHNVFIDGAGTLLNFFSSPEADQGDGDRHVTFHDNYWADAIDLGGYLNGTADANSSFTFDGNTFRDLTFGYTPADPSATDPGVIFSHNPPVMAPITFSNNHVQGDKPLMAPGPTVTLTNNAADDPPAIELVGDDVVWSGPGKHLTAWAPVATVDASKPTVQYRAGDLVTDGDGPTLYRCTADSQNEKPSTTPAKWQALPAPSDDVRVKPGTTYAGYGVQ